MESGSLFNPGFLGAHFNWWIGQIASDSTWRNNVLPGKYESKYQNPGWGRRYKVRIIGLHDQGETEIPSEFLPWAQVMYPVTGGGGQANAGATANLRQGMFVFGFFLDGQEQQVPVIMGVLGNNSQTSLSTSIGDSRVTNTQPGSLATSGNAYPADGNKDPYLRVPDEGLVVNKPSDAEQANECALLNSPRTGTGYDQYGLPIGQVTSYQLRDLQTASAEATARGLTGSEFDQFVRTKIDEGMQARCAAINAPGSPARPGATRENVDAVHELSVADVKRHDYYLRKTVLLSPCNLVDSALKAIQTELDNLTQDIDKILNTATAYIDAASRYIEMGLTIAEAIQELINNFACAIAKYLKVIFNKILEYVLKMINKALAPTLENLPPNYRNRFSDIKTILTELISCLFSKIIDGLCDQMRNYLNEELKYITPDSLPGQVATPVNPICSVEQMVGQMIAINLEQINTETESALNNVNEFLNDVRYELGVIEGFTASLDVIGDIKLSITSALSFQNITLNIFGCDLKPSCPASDYYTIHSGSGAAESPQQPRVAEVDKAAQQSVPTPQITPIPFAQPSKNQADIISDPITGNQTIA